MRAITKQGETEVAPFSGVRRSTEGSAWIVTCARRDDPRPLHVLVWGGIEDLAQALHDAPDILPKLRVYYIGGPNKKWGANACQYITNHYPALWIIEANATYRGWFVGGNQEGEWGNKEFVTRHVKAHGALGEFFASKKEDLKMGDTPSVAWLLKGTPDDPSQPGWGGRFVRAWKRPYLRVRRLPSPSDRMEVFGILEMALPAGQDVPRQPETFLLVENQSLPGYAADDGTIRFRFCPKAAQTYQFRIRSNIRALDGKAGGITAVLPSSEAARHPTDKLPNWWTDDPSPDSAEGPHIGARTVSRWREDFLRDFASRMLRCQSPASAHAAENGEEQTIRTPVKIVLVGDSTMCEYDRKLPDRGWGMFLEEAFQPGSVEVHNLARSGRSTKTFIREQLWDKALALQPDYVFIQFGHNDSHDPKNPEATDAETEYRGYLRRYIDDSRAIGATPILVTPMVRRTFHDDGTLDDNLEPYADAMKAVAKEKKVALIDLHRSSWKFFEPLGPDTAQRYARNKTDRTHFNEKGARVIAGLVLRDLPPAAPRLAKLMVNARQVLAPSSGSGR